MTDADREILRRIATGDLAAEFQAALDAVSDADPLLGGGDTDIDTLRFARRACTVIVIDEYLAVRVVGGAWPDGLPDDEDLALPASRHWRLVQALHGSRVGSCRRCSAG